MKKQELQVPELTGPVLSEKEESSREVEATIPQIISKPVRAVRSPGPARNQKPVRAVPVQAHQLAEPVLSEKEAKKQATSEKLRKMRERDLREVRGIFKFYEVPGGFLEFNFKKYKEDKPLKYNLKDGLAYTIPLMVAKHLNTSGSYPESSWVTNEVGLPVTKITSHKRRYGFQSLEFTDDEEIGSPEESKIVMAKSL